MDIFDSSYFSINKKLMCVMGIWPYNSQKKVMRTLWMIFISVLAIPHINGSIAHATDIDMLMQHLCIAVILIAAFLKHLTLILAEDKMKSVYDNIANNWLMITDEEEKKILVRYSKKGRMLTIAYICTLSLSVAFFGLIPLIPEMLNAVYPLPVPRDRIYICMGEYFVENRDDYFWMIYVTEFATVSSVVFICIAIDPMYTASVEHCSALYAIVTYRSSQLRHTAPRHNSKNSSRDTSYECVVSFIKLHQISLNFTDNVNESYSMCFLCLTLINLIDLPIVCVLTMINWNNPVSCFRYMAGFIALMIHVFVLFWPGQKLIDHSTKLLDDATCNEWYETSAKTKKILRIFMLRCTQPSLITAGGLLVMNFENYQKVVKTAASYITVLSSFR